MIRVKIDHKVAKLSNGTIFSDDKKIKNLIQLTGQLNPRDIEYYRQHINLFSEIKTIDLFTGVYDWRAGLDRKQEVNVNKCI